MKMNWIIIAVVVGVLLIVGVMFAQNMNQPTDEPMTGSDEQMMEEQDVVEDGTMMEEGDDSMMEEDPTMEGEDSTTDGAMMEESQ